VQVLVQNNAEKPRFEAQLMKLALPLTAPFGPGPGSNAGLVFQVVLSWSVWRRCTVEYWNHRWVHLLAAAQPDAGAGTEQHKPGSSSAAVAQSALTPAQPDAGAGGEVSWWWYTVSPRQLIICSR